eukprot:333772_1
MEYVIQFRAIIETFNASEFELFCSKLYQQYNKRTLIIQSLFYLLLEESKQNNQQKCNKINKIAKNIIDLRKQSATHNASNTDNNTYHTPITINNLPSTLLAFTASYLQLSDQVSLTLSNRYICSSLISSPARFHSLNVPSWFERYKNNHGEQYQTYQLNKFNKFRLVKEIILWQGVTHSIPWLYLNLDTLKLRVFLSSEMDTMERIPEQSQLKHLSLYRLWLSSSNEEFFVNLMGKLKNIECLSLIDNFLENINLLTSGICIIARKLKAFIFDEGSHILRPTENRMENILASLGNQLESLHLSFGNYHTCSLKNKFDNLKELCIVENDYGRDVHLLVWLINNAANLCRFHWTISQRYFDKEFAINILRGLIGKESVEYISVKSKSFNMFQVFEKLFESEWNKNNLKIKWHFDGELDSERLKYIKCNLLDLVSAMDRSVVDDFMFIAVCKFNSKDNNFDIMREEWDEIGKVFLCQSWQNSAGTCRKIVIMNKDNKMCGYRERWTYSCAHCN